MKRFVQRAILAYGCLASTASLAWFVGAWIFGPMMPENAGIVIAILIIHGAILTVTFHSFVQHRPFWSPVWRITDRRRKCAWGVLASAAILFLGTVIWTILLIRKPHDWKLVSDTASLTMASLALLSSLYILLHWAFRPENLFSTSLVEFASNPFAYILTYWTRR